MFLLAIAARDQHFHERRERGCKGALTPGPSAAGGRGERKRIDCVAGVAIPRAVVVAEKVPPPGPLCRRRERGAEADRSRRRRRDSTCCGRWEGPSPPAPLPQAGEGSGSGSIALQVSRFRVLWSLRRRSLTPGPSPAGGRGSGCGSIASHASRSACSGHWEGPLPRGAAAGRFAERYPKRRDSRTHVPSPPTLCRKRERGGDAVIPRVRRTGGATPTSVPSPACGRGSG